MWCFFLLPQVFGFGALLPLLFSLSLCGPFESPHFSSSFGRFSSHFSLSFCHKARLSELRVESECGVFFFCPKFLGLELCSHFSLSLSLCGPFESPHFSSSFGRFSSHFSLSFCHKARLSELRVESECGVFFLLPQVFGFGALLPLLSLSLCGPFESPHFSSSFGRFSSHFSLSFCHKARLSELRVSVVFFFFCPKFLGLELCSHFSLSLCGPFESPHFSSSFGRFSSHFSLSFCHKARLSELRVESECGVFFLLPQVFGFGALLPLLSLSLWPF